LKSGRISASARANTSTGSAPGLRKRSASKSWMSVSVKIVHGGIRAGSASLGSRVSERSSCGVPMAPAAIWSRAARKPAS